jgi:hypothetical protein
VADALDISERIARSLTERCGWDRAALRDAAALCLRAGKDATGADAVLAAVMNLALGRIAADAHAQIDISAELDALVAAFPAEVVGGESRPAFWSAVSAVLEPVAARKVAARSNPLARALSALAGVLRGREGAYAARDFALSLQGQLPYADCPVIAFAASPRSAARPSMRMIRTCPEECLSQ